MRELALREAVEAPLTRAFRPSFFVSALFAVLACCTAVFPSCLRARSLDPPGDALLVLAALGGAAAVALLAVELSRGALDYGEVKRRRSVHRGG